MRRAAVVLAVLTLSVMVGAAAGGATPGTEPIDDSSFATSFDDLVKGSDTARNAQQWSTWASEAKAANAAAAGTWRTQVAARVMPRLATVLRVALPVQEVLCTADDVYASVTYGEKKCTSIGWWIGGTVNRYFHLTGDVGRPYLPGNASNYDSASWRWQALTPSVTSSATGTGWDGVPGSTNYPYPCGVSVGAGFRDGCVTGSDTVMQLTPQQKPGSTGAGAYYYYLSTSACYVQTIGGGSQSFAYASSNSGYSCQWSTQAWGDTVNNYSQQAQQTVQQGRGHLWRFTPATSSDPGQFDVYATQDEFEHWMTVDSESSTKPSQVTISTTYNAPTYNTTTDRAAARTQLKQPGEEKARRYFDCQLNPASQWCTDPTLTNGGGSTTTVNVTPWQSFVLPKPELDETYDQYLDRLRAHGWKGVVSVAPETNTTVIASNTAAGLYPLAVTMVQVTATGAVNDVLAWPVNPPVIQNVTDPVTLLVQPSSAPVPGGGGGTTHVIDDTPPDTGTGTGLHWPTIVNPCDKFPFGVFCWIGGAVSDMATAPAVAPYIHLPPVTIPLGGVAGMPDDFATPDLTWSADTLPSSVWVPIDLIALCFAFWVWLHGMWFVGSRLMLGPGKTLEDGGAAE